MARAESVGVPTAFMPIEGAGHEGFFNNPVHGPSTFAFVNNFLYEQLELSAVVPEPSVLDFNDDSNVDVLDIDALVEEIVDGTNDALFDVTGDGTVDKFDLSKFNERKNGFFHRKILRYPLFDEPLFFQRFAYHRTSSNFRQRQTGRF